MKLVHLICQRLLEKFHLLYFYLILTTTPGDACYYYFHLKDEKAEVQRV